MKKYFDYAEKLHKKNPNMDFEDFENELVQKFGDDAEHLDVQELYVTFFH